MTSVNFSDALCYMATWGGGQELAVLWIRQLQDDCVSVPHTERAKKRKGQINTYWSVLSYW